MTDFTFYLIILIRQEDKLLRTYSVSGAGLDVKQMVEL